jgi:hypothetical protein
MITTRLKIARWNNTGGDVTVHWVPADTPLLVDPTQEEVWRFSLQVTTPSCGLGIYHGSWTQVDLDGLTPPPPLKLCRTCFEVLDLMQAHLDNA